jgi:CheY-like chemotaxis protein
LVWAQSPGSQQETGLSQPGSCFRLLLPFERQQERSQRQSPVEDKPRVLLIDDEPAIRRFVEVLMRNEYQLELAASGPEGLEKAAQCRPDLILLDIYMQGMDGFEVCRALKANPHTAGIPVAMFTAISRQHEKEKGLAAGAVDYITKPFFPRELLQRVEQLLKDHK